MPLVTVVVPAYNAARTLEATVASALAQTVEDLEVVVVDDGSTDGTGDIAASLGARVRCIRQANAGVSLARNAAIASSDAAFVALLDADDAWEPTKLERQLALFERPEVGVAYCGVQRVSESGAPIDLLSAVEHEDPCKEMLLHSSIMALSSGVVRRELLEHTRFDPRFSQCADWHLWLRLSLRTGFAAVQEPLLRYRTSASNMSSNIELLERDTFGVLDDFFTLPESAAYGPIRPRVYSNHWMIVSGSYLHTGAPTAAVRCLLRGLAADPSNLPRAVGAARRGARRLAGYGPSSSAPGTSRK